tara:strand:- start:107 stop:307 length:201 start_codon:yes stop_codon:yes gene_type:complete
MEPKQQLADLMDAFATAKASQNETLQRLVLAQVNQFFSTHEIVPLNTTMSAPPEPQQPEDSMTSWG